MIESPIVAKGLGSEFEDLSKIQMDVAASKKGKIYQLVVKGIKTQVLEIEESSDLPEEQ